MFAKLRIYSPKCSQATDDLYGTFATGSRVWAGALMLVRWLASLTKSSQIDLSTGPILELGSGTGLVGISLAKLGHKVVLSDREQVVLDSIRCNIEENGVQNNCRVLPLDWKQVNKPRMLSLLRSQRFSAVIGSDILYEKEHPQLVVDVLQKALPHGGRAFLTNPKWHRRDSVVDSFANLAREAGFSTVAHEEPCAGVLQEHFCKDYEPNQEYVLHTLRIEAAGLPTTA
jgi:predicted nicotinamide N-methyase